MCGCIIITGKDLQISYKAGKLEEAVKVFRRLRGDGEADRLLLVGRSGNVIDISSAC